MAEYFGIKRGVYENTIFYKEIPIDVFINSGWQKVYWVGQTPYHKLDEAKEFINDCIDKHIEMVIEPHEDGLSPDWEWFKKYEKFRIYNKNEAFA